MLRGLFLTGKEALDRMRPVRSPAATAANQVLIQQYSLDYQIPDLKYCFDGTVYKRVYYGYRKNDVRIGDDP